MVSQKITITNPSGLHLRPAGELSKIATYCKSNITIVKDEKHINPKSILNLMSAGIKYNDQIIVECIGPNEEEDLKTIINAIQTGLGSKRTV